MFRALRYINIKNVSSCVLSCFTCKGYNICVLWFLPNLLLMHEDAANAANLLEDTQLISCLPGCIPCKVYAEDTPILTIDSIVICQTHAEDLRRRLLKMHPGLFVFNATCTVRLCRFPAALRRSNLSQEFSFIGNNPIYQISYIWHAI